MQIYLFGDFRVVDRGETITALRGRSQQLLAYLILHHQAPQPRRRVAEALWPETQTAQALTNLRKELYHLRQAASPVDQLLAVTAKTLHWQPQVPCDVDIERFETALAEAEKSQGKAAVLALETALSACQGELWPDCDAAWMYPEQVRIQQSYVRALSQLTQMLQASGETAKAITFGQRWLQANPLDEGATHSLMALSAEAGDRATALRLYHQCMSALQSELGVSPGQTTTTLYQQLLRAEESVSVETPAETLKPTQPISEPPSRSAPPPLLLTPSSLATSSSPVLIGREALFQSLEEWLFSPESSTAPLLLLTGEPGIGKTRLLEALAETAVQHQWQPCWGRAFAAEQLRAYGVWIDLLQAAPADWSSEASTQTQRDLLKETLRDRGQLLDRVVRGLSEKISIEQPLLLLFDDIQWLDDSSTTLLHYVFRLLGQSSLRIACAARSPELQENAAALKLVQSLRRAQRLQEIAVPPLSAESVLALVKSRQADVRSRLPNLEQLYASSGGNPLFAIEAARANRLPASAEGNSLSGLIEDRLRRLDRAARDLLPWAAALGRRFNPEILALAASYPPMQFLTAIEQLEQQQLVRPAPSVHEDEHSHYDFVHDLVRQVAYSQLSAPRRRIVHGELAATLNAQTVDDDLASQVAYHAGLAGKHALAAQAYTAAAARSLRLFAYEEAIQLVARGLDHCQYLPSRDRLLYSAQLWRSRVFAGVSSAEAEAVNQHLQQLLAQMTGLALTEAEVIAQQALAYLSYSQDKISDAHQQCLKSLDIVFTDPRLQAETLATNGSCLAAIERDMERAEALLLEAQPLANRLGLSLIDIDLGLGCVYRYRGDYDLAHRHLQQALQLSKNKQDHLQAGCCLFYLALTAWDQHQPRQDYAQALLKLSPQLPPGSEAAFAQALITLQAYAAAPHPAQSAQSVVEALKHLDQLDAQRKVIFVASHAAETALTRGEVENATTFARVARQSAYTVDHPNDIAIAEALCLLCGLTTDNEETIRSHWQAISSEQPAQFSARTQALITQAKAAMAKGEKTREKKIGRKKVGEEKATASEVSSV
ncbi:MAG: BTAD domain-containing putative transcriptional regulator [Phormidesmis sp.]